jgi:hypothetical protein
MRGAPQWHKVPMFRHTATLFWLCLAGAAYSQPETAKHSLRILAIGDPPPFVQQVRDGVRYEVPPPPEMIPPRNLVLPVPAKDNKIEKAEPLSTRLRLSQISTPMVMPMPESKQVTLKTDTGSPWLDIPLQQSPATLAIVWRGGKDWKTPKVITLPDDAHANASGNVNFSNVSPFPIGVTFRGENIRLNPGMSYSRNVSGSSSTPLEISYFTANGTPKKFHSASIEGMNGISSRLVIYQSDAKNPRNPIKVLQLEERVQQPALTVTAR